MLIERVSIFVIAGIARFLRRDLKLWYRRFTPDGFNSITLVIKLCSLEAFPYSKDWTENISGVGDVPNTDLNIVRFSRVAYAVMATRVYFSSSPRFTFDQLYSHDSLENCI